MGLLITYGKFRMADLADLEAHLSHDLNLMAVLTFTTLNVHG
jgi:hypothetical protein